MHKLAPLFFLWLGILTSQAQSTYQKDWHQLYTAVQQLPSYREQMKGESKVAYALGAERLKNVQPTSDFQEFYTLSQLLLPFRDNHLAFYQNPKQAITKEMLVDSAWITAYRQSESFLGFPRATLARDSLEAVLQNTAFDQVEGVYHYESYLQVGIYRTARKDSLLGVVLHSRLPHWQPGQLAFILREFKPDHFRAYHAHLLQKTFLLVKNEKFIPGRLTETPWKKESKTPDYVNYSGKVFELKALSDQVQYLHLGSFSTSPQELLKSAAFYDRIKDSLHAPQLIVDLRNNGGGGFKASRKFLHLLQRYTRRGTVYALVNHRTFSNAEQFALELRKLKRVTLLGSTTNGTLTYGNNYGKRMALPSGKYTLYPTDMKDSGHYQRYEEVGVAPDILLDYNRDWKEQTLNYIRQTANR
ncbi:hypothetical protein BWI97_17705 [Siphonobacter sp. BAB-5405]|uniref:S41 family peptidase n=1 Tax=Siphonobacter sp. BAB-5405 TaxID=1864825 RepID=UPI000C80FBE8|nr:S41 family peptidase [Siphonobacter sp. BAB-5405]PMD93777.1 hypothetical protein BWI97_17705 [Siphonobacter sp. BAB-5405]